MTFWKMIKYKGGSQSVVAKDLVWGRADPIDETPGFV